MSSNLPLLPYVKPSWIIFNFPATKAVFHFQLQTSLNTNWEVGELELELELIQIQMTQKPTLRAEVYARALRASQNRKKEVCRGEEVRTPPPPPSLSLKLKLFMK